MNKKSMIGIGTLIVFIAGILAAAISAGVILTTQSRLQNKALDVGAKARKGVSINFQTVEVRTIKDNTGNYTELLLIMKLAPGSGDARLNKTIIDVVLENNSGIYRWQGNSTFFVNKRRRTIHEEINTTHWTRLHSDLDFDFIEDKIKVYNSTTLLVNLSKDGQKYVTIKDISSAGQTFDNNYTINGNVENTIHIEGTTTKSNTIDSDMLIIYPYELYVGYGNFAVDYAIEDKNHKRGVVIEGEVFRIYLETIEPLQEEQDLLISIKKETGQVQRTMIALPSILTDKREKIYP
jgi:archaellin